MAINYKEELAKAAIGIAATIVGTVITTAITAVAEDISSISSKNTDDITAAYAVVTKYRGVRNLSFAAAHKINSAAAKILQAEADRFASACKRAVAYTALPNKDIIYSDIDNRFVVRGKVTTTNIQQRYITLLNEVTEIAKMYKLRVSVNTEWPIIKAISEH